MWQSLKILNVIITLTLKQVFWKTKSSFQKLEYRFLVESATMENAIFPLCKCYFGWYDNKKWVLNRVNFCTRHISWTKENCRRETKWRNKRFAFQEKVGEIHLIIKSVLNCVNVRTSYISWTKEISKKEEEMKEWKMCITRKDMRNSSHILNINNVIKTNWN